MHKTLESKEKEEGRVILEEDIIRKYEKSAFCSAKSWPVSRQDLGGTAMQLECLCMV